MNAIKWLPSTLLFILAAVFSSVGKREQIQDFFKGFTTRREDLEVNWKEYYKYNK